MKYLLAPAPGDAGGAEGSATPRNVGLDLLRGEQGAKKKKEKHQRKGKAAFVHSSPSMKHLPAGLRASCAHECSPRRKSESSTHLIEMQSSELPVLVFTQAAAVPNLLKTPQVLQSRSGALLAPATQLGRFRSSRPQKGRRQKGQSKPRPWHNLASIYPSELRRAPKLLQAPAKRES